MSEASDPLVHLLRPQGGSQCGRPGPVDADINFITCDDCDEQHEALQEPRCISYEVAMAGGSTHPEAVVAELRNLAMIAGEDAEPEDRAALQIRLVKLSSIVLEREDRYQQAVKEIAAEQVAREAAILAAAEHQRRADRAEEQVRYLSALRGVDAAEMGKLRQERDEASKENGKLREALQRLLDLTPAGDTMRTIMGHPVGRELDEKYSRLDAARNAARRLLGVDDAF